MQTAPSKQGLDPQSSDLSALSPFNLTSYYFLPEAWESGRGQCIKFKRGISRFIKNLLFVKEKKNLQSQALPIALLKFLLEITLLTGTAQSEGSLGLPYSLQLAEGPILQS